MNKHIKKNYIKVAALLAATFILLSMCQNRAERGSSKVYIDEEFNRLFSPDSNGVTGADGIFSVDLLDGSSMFLMGDSFLGKVVNGQRDLETKMMNNSFIHVNKNRSEAKAIHGGTYNKPESLIIPKQHGDTNYWYWPGHGFVEDAVLYTFALNMYTDPALIIKSTKPEHEQDIIDKMSEAMFAFQVAGVDLIKFKLPEMVELERVQVEQAYETDIHFGNSVFTDMDYRYFLGTKNYPDKSYAHVARVKIGKGAAVKNWEFFDGENWTNDVNSSQKMNIDISVSEQFSLFKIKDKYVLLIQEKGKGDIYTYTSDYPYKGFSNKQFIYHTPETDNEVPGMSTYNAMAHPQYIEDNELLVSYCTNAGVREIFIDVNNYRPRFIRVPLSLIDSRW